MGDDVSVVSATNPARQIRVAQLLFVHPGYNAQTLINDIAVIRVETPFVRSSTFFPVPQAFATPADNSTCSVAGWGSTVEVVDFSVISNNFINSFFFQRVVWGHLRY